QQQASALVARHGADSGAVLQLLKEDASLVDPIVAGRTPIRAEVLHAVRAEMALTLEDVMRRRLQLFYELPDGGVEAAEAVARLMAPVAGLDWDPDRVASEAAA